MNLARLQKQLAKDVKKSPGKAAALGLLTLLALYAWVPLLLSEQSADRPPQGPPTASQFDPATQTVTSQVSPAHTPLSWQQLAAWIDSDPRMKPATLILERTSPFAGARPTTADISSPGLASQQDASPAEVLDPRSLGLKVSSTMLGKHRRVAVVNGRPYAEGRQLQIGQDVTFTLAQVGMRHIVLERDGQRYDLPVADDHSQPSSP